MTTFNALQVGQRRISAAEAIILGHDDRLDQACRSIQRMDEAGRRLTETLEATGRLARLMDIGTSAAQLVRLDGAGRGLEKFYALR